jgi:anti-sigma factor RsiW
MAVELLPWFVNESLDPEERDAVAEHASSCVICRRELDELQVLYQSVAAIAAATDVPEPDMRRINARIDAQLRSEQRENALVTAWRKFSSNRLRLAFAVQTAALIVVVGVLLLPREPDPVFGTLTTAEPLPAGHFVRVVFGPTVTDDEVSGLLSANGLTVFSGPTDRGVMTLQFADTASFDERTVITATLQSDGRILFAQSVEGAN